MIFSKAFGLRIFSLQNHHTDIIILDKIASDDQNLKEGRRHV